MSYENIGKTSATAVVANEGGNFPIDGGDPAVIIEAAWTYVSGLGGGSIFLDGAGERWTLSTEINSQGDNVVLHGGGVGGPELYLGNALDVDVFNTTHDNIYLGWLDINGNWTNQSRDDGSQPGGPWFAVSRGIRNTGENVHIYNSYIHEIAQHGITYAECEGGVAHHNLVSNIGWNGIFSYRLASPGYGVIIHDNEIEHCGDVGAGMYGSRVNVHHNYIHDMDGSFGSGNTRWGAGIEGGDWNKINDNIIDDILVGISTGSVAGEDPQFWEISRNHIMGQTGGAGGHGIYIKARNGQVKNNWIEEIPAYSGNFPVGIFVGSSANNVEVTGNHFNGPSTYLGIQIGGPGAGVATDIDFLQNQFHGAPWGGFYVATNDGACNRLSFKDNRVYDGARGIGMTDNTKCYDWMIANNYFYSLTSYGCDIQNIEDCHIIGNIFRDCALGVDISNANAVNTSVDGNDFDGCTNTISDAGSTNTLYGGNKDNAGPPVWIENVAP